MLVQGVGEYTRGVYKCCINGKKTKEYVLWHCMLIRCYSSVFHGRSPSYIGCTVCPEWHNFQVFAEWCNNQVGFNTLDDKGKVYHLDKDILVKGNKVYSPSNCVFVPVELNILLITKLESNGLPKGVHWSTLRNKYVAQLKIKNKTKGVGRFDTIEDAFAAYKIAKELYIKEVLYTYKDAIDPRAYQALLNYKVEITD